MLLMMLLLLLQIVAVAVRIAMIHDNVGGRALLLNIVTNIHRILRIAHGCNNQKLTILEVGGLTVPFFCSCCCCSCWPLFCGSPLEGDGISCFRMVSADDNDRNASLM